MTEAGQKRASEEVRRGIGYLRGVPTRSYKRSKAECKLCTYTVCHRCRVEQASEHADGRRPEWCLTGRVYGTPLQTATRTGTEAGDWATLKVHVDVRVRCRCKCEVEERDARRVGGGRHKV